MATQAPMDPAQDPATDTAGLIAAGEKAVQSLGILLKECHRLDPNSPACDAIASMIKGVGEVEAQYSGAGPAQAPPTDLAGAVGQLHQATMAGAAQPPVQ